MPSETAIVQPQSDAVGRANVTKPGMPKNIGFIVVVSAIAEQFDGVAE